MHETATPRNDWTVDQAENLFALPFNDLLFQAHQVHRECFDPNEIQISTLLSIKTGACPEDCKYCPQSARYKTGLEVEKLISIEEVVAKAKQAKANGAGRFCMGAAWRNPKPKDMERVADMVRQVKSLGLETCMTLGMLDEQQASTLSDAGLDYYNHNIDTSPDYYPEVITTRTFDDRLKTLENVRNANMKVCCGGIVGMGESETHRAGLMVALANLPEHPQSVPINQLVQVKGTPMYGEESLDPLDFIRSIAVARIMLPRSMVRLSAGRSSMSDEMQALCFFAGANSIFYGDKLLTTENPEENEDMRLFSRLGLKSMQQPQVA